MLFSRKNRRGFSVSLKEEIDLAIFISTGRTFRIINNSLKKRVSEGWRSRYHILFKIQSSSGTSSAAGAKVNVIVKVNTDIVGLTLIEEDQI